MHFITAVTGYRMFGHKCSKDIREELEITDISTVTKTCQKKWLEHLDVTPETEISKLLCHCKSRGRRYQNT
jgi:hypothetical protein